MHLCGSSLNIPRVPSVLPLPRNPHVSLTLGKVHNPYSLWPWVLDTFDFWKRFAPQLRALFGQLSFQKCSEAEVLLQFLLPKVLSATGGLFQHLNCQSWRFRICFFLIIGLEFFFTPQWRLFCCSFIQPYGFARAALATLYFRTSLTSLTAAFVKSEIWLLDFLRSWLILLIHYVWTEHKGENDGWIHSLTQTSGSARRATIAHGFFGVW